VRVDGKVAVVIGGSSGIGRAVTLGLAREGAAVVPAARSRERVDAVVAEVADAGGKALAGYVDTTSEGELTTLRDQVLETFGRVDVLVNSAGTLARTTALETSVEDWNRVLEVNLTGAFLACRIFGEAMTAQRGGRVVSITSMASHVGLPQAAAYTASKGGLLALSRALAREWMPTGVTVNTVSPGFFLTDLNAHLLQEGSERRRRIEERTPAGRLGQLDELVGAVVYLASDGAGFVTGVDLPVDGGFLASGF
jgi:NAD(P)-dependent dehydrogenase (short-subunit alcohol dehydrogenase family)